MHSYCMKQTFEASPLGLTYLIMECPICGPFWQLLDATKYLVVGACMRSPYWNDQAAELLFCPLPEVEKGVLKVVDVK